VLIYVAAELDLCGQELKRKLLKGSW